VHILNIRRFSSRFRCVVRYSIEAVVCASCSFAGTNGGADLSEQCVLRVPNLSTPPPVPPFAYGFVIGYCISYIGAVILNRESATFTLLINVASSCATSAFFLIPGQCDCLLFRNTLPETIGHVIYPAGMNPNPNNTPLW
jgi:hypothetical protein